MHKRAFKPVLDSITLEGHGVRLVPLKPEHATALCEAASDGELWRLRMTSVPEPHNMEAYIEQALTGQVQGSMLPFAVMDLHSERWVGSTRYHDIVPGIARLEIGYTWYAKSVQRSHVNTACKLLLLEYAFESLEAALVGWRTDNYNYASQQAILRLGAKFDGCLRHHARRRDGTVRDTMMYSLSAAEWPESKAQLLYRLQQHAA